MQGGRLSLQSYSSFIGLVMCPFWPSAQENCTLNSFSVDSKCLMRHDVWRLKSHRMCFFCCGINSSALCSSDWLMVISVCCIQVIVNSPPTGCHHHRRPASQFIRLDNKKKKRKKEKKAGPHTLFCSDLQSFQSKCIERSCKNVLRGYKMCDAQGELEARKKCLLPIKKAPGKRNLWLQNQCSVWSGPSGHGIRAGVLLM